MDEDQGALEEDAEELLDDRFSPANLELVMNTYLLYQYFAHLDAARGARTIFGDYAELVRLHCN